MSLPFWEFGGTTMVTTNYVRLTADLQSRSGSIWNQVVCILSNTYININYL